MKWNATIIGRLSWGVWIVAAFLLSVLLLNACTNIDYWLHRYQTLIVGVAAVITAVFIYIQTRRQIFLTRQSGLDASARHTRTLNAQYSVEIKATLRTINDRYIDLLVWVSQIRAISDFGGKIPRLPSEFDCNPHREPNFILWPPSAQTALFELYVMIREYRDGAVRIRNAARPTVANVKIPWEKATKDPLALLRGADIAIRDIVRIIDEYVARLSSSDIVDMKMQWPDHFLIDGTSLPMDSSEERAKEHLENFRLQLITQGQTEHADHDDAS